MKKFHTFYLTKQNTGGSMVSTDPTKERKRHCESHTIFSFELIKDPRPLKHGKTWIANVPGEKSIFVDEQRDPDIIEKIKTGKRKVPVIQFTEGRRNVSDDNVIELEFLRNSRFNEKNKVNNRDRTFFEFKPAEISKEQVRKEMEDLNIKSKIVEMGLTKLKSVSRVSEAIKNMNTFDQVDPDILKHKLIVICNTQQGKARIQAIMEDGMLEQKFDIYEALDKRIIKWQPNNDWNLMWPEGGIICNVPAGTEDKVGYAAKYLHEKGLDTLNTIRKMLGREAVLTGEEAVSKEVGSIREWIKDATKEQIVDRMIEWNKDNPKYLLMENRGPYYYLEGEKICEEKGRDALKKELLSNPGKYQVIYEKWATYVF